MFVVYRCIRSLHCCYLRTACQIRSVSSSKNNFSRFRKTNNKQNDKTYNNICKFFETNKIFIHYLLLVHGLARRLLIRIARWINILYSILIYVFQNNKTHLCIIDDYFIVVINQEDSRNQNRKTFAFRNIKFECSIRWEVTLPPYLLAGAGSNWILFRFVCFDSIYLSIIF